METITDLNLMFKLMKELLQPYSPPLVPKAENNRSFDLWSIKKIEIEGRKRSEVFFASIVIQKDYVGFYFMPVYSHPEMKAFFRPELLDRLMGKSCFHIRKLDETLLDQIRAALQAGYVLYRDRGWI